MSKKKGKIIILNSFFLKNIGNFDIIDMVSRKKLSFFLIHMILCIL